MNRYLLADKYIISEIDDELFWEELVELEGGEKMILKGQCFLDEKLDMLFLSPWEENFFEDFKIDEDIENWNKSTYYSIVEDNGGLAIYYTANGKKTDADLQKKLSEKIGCTMKYR